MRRVERVYMPEQREYSGLGNLVATDGSVTIYLKVPGEPEPVAVDIGQPRAYNLTTRRTYVTAKRNEPLTGPTRVTGCIEVRGRLEQRALRQGTFVLHGQDGLELPIMFRGFFGPWGLISPAGAVKAPRSERRDVRLV
jgi:hypothetical protein